MPNPVAVVCVLEHEYNEAENRLAPFAEHFCIIMRTSWV